MKPVVLVNPNYQKAISAVAQITIGPPLGLAYLASSLENGGRRTVIIDANAEELSAPEVARRVRELDPLLVGLSAVTPTVEICHDTAAAIRGVLPAVPIAVGGTHPTVLPSRTLAEFPAFDLAVVGEGEHAVGRLAEALENGGEMEGVPGLCFRRDGLTVENAPDGVIEDLDSLPLPARHLLPNHLYRSMESGRFNGIIAMRGCPGKCVYCSVQHVFGKKIRLRKPENVAEEVLLCHRDFGTRFLSFMDDTFTWNREWVQRLCAEMRNRSVAGKVRWICLTRADSVDRETLVAMKQAGCVRIELGIESGSQAILDRMRKGVRVDQIREAFRAAREAGISTFGFAMVNFPGEDLKTLRLTRDLILEVDPDLLQLSYATPYPGTELYELCRREGLLTSERWSDYVFLRKSVIRNPGLARGQLEKEFVSIQRAFFLRPRYLARTLLRTLRSGNSLAGLCRAGLNTIRKTLLEPRPAGGTR